MRATGNTEVSLNCWLPRLVGAIVLLGLPALVGCTNTIRPPASPVDPVIVYLVDHGRHPSLIIPVGEDCFIRYVYGDWTWYALGRTGICQGAAAMLWPTRAGLGRAELSTARPLDEVGNYDPVQHTYILSVERADAERLRRELDALFAAGAPTYYYNSSAFLGFVHHPRLYTVCHNCNHVMKDWLQRLGCRVTGTAMLSQWRVATPEPQPAP